MHCSAGCAVRMRTSSLIGEVTSSLFTTTPICAMATRSAWISDWNAVQCCPELIQLLRPSGSRALLEAIRRRGVREQQFRATTRPENYALAPSSCHVIIDFSPAAPDTSVSVDGAECPERGSAWAVGKCACSRVQKPHECRQKRHGCADRYLWQQQPFSVLIQLERSDIFRSVECRPVFAAAFVFFRD